MCKYDPLVYQIVSDAWCESAIYHNGGDFSAFCQLAQYQHLFNPIAVKRGHNTTSYRASCSGDFYGNGAIEVASAIANSDISISSVNSTSHINTISVTNNQFNLSWRGMASGNMENQLLGDEVVTVTDNEIKIFNFSSGPTYIANLNNPGSQFNGVAVGEFDPDHQGPEILTEDNSDGRLHLYSYSASIISPLTLNNSFISNNLSGITVGNFDRMNPNEIAIFDNTSGHIKIFKILNNTLTLLYDYVITSSSLNYWNGITAGDFDGDGQDEIIGHRNLDGAFFVFKVKNSILGNPDGETFPIDQQNGVLCSAKLSIDQTKSALVTFRNFDGQITIFNMDGLCPNLNLSGQTINDASSIDYNPNYVAAIINNNFPLDYHVNNTLVAGNNFNIVSPSIVTFTAGNEIILKDGFTATTGCDFHAYIDPGIACNPQNFRVANPNVSNTNSVSQQPNSIKKSNEISVKPNPAEGKFTYFINEYEQKEIIYHICVIDLLGNIIYKEDRNSSSGEIDLSQYYNGVYFLRINSDDGKTWQERLIVSH